MTRIYQVVSALDTSYHGDRKVADAEARARADDSGEIVMVELLQLVTHLSPKDLACALLSGKGWCDNANSRIVRYVKPRKTPG